MRLDLNNLNHKELICLVTVLKDVI